MDASNSDANLCRGVNSLFVCYLPGEGAVEHFRRMFGIATGADARFAVMSFVLNHLSDGAPN